MDIREFEFDENEELDGIKAISFVTYPAIEKDFIYLSSQNFLKSKGIDKPETDTQKLLTKDGNWKFWRMATRGGQSPTIDTSHGFCKNHAVPPNNIYHIDEIRRWNQNLSNDEKKGWIEESNFTRDFKGKGESNFNMDQQLYNCRHFLTPVRDIREVPPQKEYLLSNRLKEVIKVNLSITNKEQRIVKGAAMIPNILIYRIDEYGKPFYIYFKKETIKKLKEKYGFNRNITIQHLDDITGNAILLNSWIYPEVNDDCGIKNMKDGTWCVEYKILNDKLWDVIKKQNVKGFSVEIIVSG